MRSALQVEAGRVRRGGRARGRRSWGAPGAAGGRQGGRGRRSGGVAAGLRGGQAAGQGPPAAAGGAPGEARRGQGAVAPAPRLLLSDASADSTSVVRVAGTLSPAVTVAPHLLCVVLYNLNGASCNTDCCRRTRDGWCYGDMAYTWRLFALPSALKRRNNNRHLFVSTFMKSNNTVQ